MGTTWNNLETSGGSAEPVIIVGCGPVGLGAALELARFGVRSVIIERHDSTSRHPKTRVFNTRTLEIARGWGVPVTKRWRNIDAPDDWKTPIRFLSSLTGVEFGHINTPGFAGPGSDVSPTSAVLSSQEKLEAILLDAVRATGQVEVSFGFEAVRLIEGGGAQDTQAQLEVRDRKSGTVETITGPALIAADGAASTIRGELGVQLAGPQGMSHIINCYFKADIESRIEQHKGVILFVSNDRVQGVLQPLDAAGRWLCQIAVDEARWSLDAFSKEDARDWIRHASGIPDLEPDIVTMGLWRLNATIVERLTQGRVLFCGDAAHQFPPTGGLGVNSGIQGMHNAMWKLALCVQGKAGWPLLQTYHDERHALTERIVQQSLENSINVNRIFAAAAGDGESGLSTEAVVAASRRYGNHSGVEFGACYASSAVVADGTNPPAVADDYSDYVQSGTPGCRAPHLWLGQPDARLSTLDLFGPGFTLLLTQGAAALREEGAATASALGLSINTYVIGSPGLEDQGQFERLYGLATDGCVLVRPDGHVALRCRSISAGKPDLTAALRSILSL